MLSHPHFEHPVQSSTTASSIHSRPSALQIINIFERGISTSGHRTGRTRDPVRSPIFKPCTDTLVVGWVTSTESVLLDVRCSFALLFDLILIFGVLRALMCNIAQSDSYRKNMSTLGRAYRTVMCWKLASMKLHKCR